MAATERPWTQVCTASDRSACVIARRRRRRFPSPARAQIGSDRYSSIVVDAATGNVLEEANPDAPRHPASLAKLMTLYMAFEALRDRRITLTACAGLGPRRRDGAVQARPRCRGRG